ncbi:MAG: DUF262 domain-containing protein, partial [Bacteroidetes bacterium]|nr:DUF262 domain-containing protein [Bacteroidota bacterium]
EELVLKFFAYYERRNQFVHSVKDFLNDYMADKTALFKNKAEFSKIFNNTFSTLNKFLPDGIVRGNRKNITPLILFEAISIGVADILEIQTKINKNQLQKLLDDKELAKLTTGATNSRIKLNQRIDFVKNKLTI